MRICIDSSALIPGIQGDNSIAARLLESIGPELNLIIPRLIAQEVTRNLTTSEQGTSFLQAFSGAQLCFYC